MPIRTHSYHVPDLSSADAPLVQIALGWSCDICQAPKGVLCRNPIHPDRPLPRPQLVHDGRLTDRRRERRGDS